MAAGTAVEHAWLRPRLPVRTTASAFDISVPAAVKIEQNCTRCLVPSTDITLSMAYPRPYAFFVFLGLGVGQIFFPPYSPDP